MADMASLTELLPLAAGLAASGAVAGLLAGLFGVGGGAVMVPVLYQFLTVLGVDEAVRMHVSVGTSLGIIIPTSIRSFLAHRARGAVDMKLLRSWLLPVPVGVLIAALIAAHVSPAGLKAIFAAICVVIGTRMLTGVGRFRLGRDIPGNPLRWLIGIVIGLLSTLMGVGGGVMNNTLMTLFGRPMHQAVATSSGVGTLISIPGMLGFVWAGWGAAGLPPFSAGFVNLLGVALVIPVTTYAAPLGVRIAHALPRRRLEFAFGVFLLAVALRFFASLFWTGPASG